MVGSAWCAGPVGPPPSWARTSDRHGREGGGTGRRCLRAEGAPYPYRSCRSVRQWQFFWPLFAVFQEQESRSAPFEVYSRALSPVLFHTYAPRFQ